MFSLHHTSHYVCSRCLQTTQTKSNRWCKSLMMYNRKGRNGERKKLKRKVLPLWLVTVMTADGEKTENRESEREMKHQRNNLVKNWARPVHRQVIAKPAWGWRAENKSTIFVGNVWKISIFMGGVGKRCLTVCNYVCRLRDMTPLSWYDSDISVITGRKDLGGVRTAQRWTAFCLSEELCIITQQQVQISVSDRVGGSLHDFGQGACTFL